MTGPASSTWTDPERLWADVRSRTQRYVKSARKAGITITREGHRVVGASSTACWSPPRSVPGSSLATRTRTGGSWTRSGRTVSHLLMARTHGGPRGRGAAHRALRRHRGGAERGHERRGRGDARQLPAEVGGHRPGGCRRRPPLRHVGHRARRHRPVQGRLWGPRGALSRAPSTSRRCPSSARACWRHAGLGSSIARRRRGLAPC